MSLRSKLSRLSSAGPGSAPSEDAAASANATPGARASVLEDLRARMQKVLEKSARTPPRPPPPVDTSELPFATLETALGPLHVRMQRLSAAHRTGRAPLIAGRDARAEILALLALDPSLAACDPSRALFLDTETTGLSGGTGTVAFLVGLAFWDPIGAKAPDQATLAAKASDQISGLIVEQLLVRALGEEAPMLERVAERIRNASMLVTFNGKSFDMPLLRTRFAMARMPVPVEPPHLDLLHVARRVHKARGAGACKLTAIERSILGFERHDDVPSGEVSACYLHFLRTGDTRAMLGVIEHNAWDVVAMAALVGLYGEPFGGGDADDGVASPLLAAEDLAGIARTLRRAGALDAAMDAANVAVERGTTHPEALRARAEIAKARGDRQRALVDLESVVDSVDDPRVRLELAKLYEHYVREPARALAMLERGVAERDPERRKTRLQHKIEKLEKKHQADLFGPAKKR